MLILMAIANFGLASASEFRLVESRFGTDATGTSGVVAVCLRNGAGQPRWMLLDSGSYLSFAKRDDAERGELRYADGRGSALALKPGKVPQGYRWIASSIAPDGVLGADNMSGLAWFVDYRNRKLWVRPASEKRGSALEAAFVATGRKRGGTLALPLERDPDEGTWWTRLAQGGTAPIRWIIDTGANQCSVSAALPGIGDPVSSAFFSESLARRRRDGRLLQLRLPSGSVPLLAFSSEGEDDAVLSPWSLTRDWMLLDPGGRRATFPRPTSGEMARRVADSLTYGLASTRPDQIRELANVGSPQGLARARAVAKGISENFEKERAKAVAEREPASRPAVPSANSEGYKWVYYKEPGVWGEVPKAIAMDPLAPISRGRSGYRWVYFDKPGTWGEVPETLSALPSPPPSLPGTGYRWRYIPDVGWVEDYED